MDVDGINVSTQPLGVTQMPFEQACSTPQSEHASPFAPQVALDCSRPSMQVVPWQQPAQFQGPQSVGSPWPASSSTVSTGPTQVPLVQLASASQRWQAWPPPPQAKGAVPDWQIPEALQHPPQVWGPQGGLS
jgi:hypothetical protein